MTVALGLKCLDGMVLVTDSLESDGVTKRYVNKISSYQVGREWGIAIASAGEADLAESFNENLFSILGNEGFDHMKLLGTLRLAIAQTRKTYPDSQLEMLVAVFGPPFTKDIYRVMADSKHLGPVQSYEALGIGSSIAKFLCSQIYMPFIRVDEAVRLGIFTISRCNEHVDGCGGPVSVLTYKQSERQWHVEEPKAVVQVQAELEVDKFRKNLIDFWVATNALVDEPNIDRYRNYAGGGYVRGRWVPKNDSPKPSVSRKSEPKQ